jgi:hypothetical protein
VKKERYEPLNVLIALRRKFPCSAEWKALMNVNNETNYNFSENCSISKPNGKTCVSLVVKTSQTRQHV